MTTEVQTESKGTEAIEKLMDLAAKNIALGIKIGKGGLDASDMVYAPQVFANLQELVQFVASRPEIVAEVKDLDVSEGIKLLEKLYAEYKEVKEEVK